ncbi:MAG TPA: hypothetical protein VGE31_00620 [Candidatus Paceibacterota bacterium]
MTNPPRSLTNRQTMLKQQLVSRLERALDQAKLLDPTIGGSTILANELILIVRAGVDLFGPDFFFSSLGEMVVRTNRLSTRMCICCPEEMVRPATQDDHLCDVCRNDGELLVAEIEAADAVKN